MLTQTNKKTERTMTKKTLTDRVFNFYAAPFRLLDVFIQRTHKDAEKMHAGNPSLTEIFMSPHAQSYGRNAICTMIVAGTTFAAAATSVVSIPASFVLFSIVAAKSVQALNVEEKYQAKQRMERKLAAM
jgi:hypothetical protein